MKKIILVLVLIYVVLNIPSVFYSRIRLDWIKVRKYYVELNKKYGKMPSVNQDKSKADDITHVNNSNNTF